MIWPTSRSFKCFKARQLSKSAGDSCHDNTLFNRAKLLALLTGLAVERLKATIITQQGVISFNQVDGALSYSEADEAMLSRIEVIGLNASTWESLESLLLEAINIS